MTTGKHRSSAVHTDTSLWRHFQWIRAGRRYGPTILDRYVFNEIVQPFFLSVLFWTSFFMVVILKDVVGELLGKNVEPGRIAIYLIVLLGEKVTQTIPISCLFAGILAAGRLSGDSEITAMRSAGISYPRIYNIFIFSGFLSTVLVISMDFYLGPLCSRAREDFEDWLRAYHSLTLVRPGRFLGRADMDGITKKGQDIYAENRLGNSLREVQIREWYNDVDLKSTDTVVLKGVSIPIGNGFLTQVIHAESGELLSRSRSDGKEEKFIRFRKGFLIEVDDKQSAYQVTSFFDGFMDYVIPPPVKPIGRLNVKPENYTYPELFDFLNKLESGGSEVNLDAMMEGQGAVAGAKASGNVIKLPGKMEMENMVRGLQLEIMQKCNPPGQPGGLTDEECQLRVRTFLQLQVFLKDVDKTKRRFELEIHKRVSGGVACMLFFFAAFPLGLVVRRSGKGMSFGLALMVCAGYYVVLLSSQTQALQGGVSPALGAWIPDILVAAAGFYIMSTRTEGFSPFGFLTRPLRKPLARVTAPVRNRIDDLVHSSLFKKIVARIDRMLGRFKKM